MAEWGNVLVVLFVSVLVSAPTIWGFFQAAKLSRDMERRMDVMQTEIDDLREGREIDHEEMRDLRDGIGLLVDQLRQARMEPVWTPNEVKRRPRGGGVALAKRIAAGFSAEELDSLVFELGISRESLPGETGEKRAQELVRYMDSRGRINDLRRAVDENRPQK